MFFGKSVPSPPYYAIHCDLDFDMCHPANHSFVHFIINFNLRARGWNLTLSHSIDILFYFQFGVTARCSLSETGEHDIVAFSAENWISYVSHGLRIGVQSACTNKLSWKFNAIKFMEHVEKLCVAIAIDCRSQSKRNTHSHSHLVWWLIGASILRYVSFAYLPYVRRRQSTAINVAFIECDAMKVCVRSET